MRAVTIAAGTPMRLPTGAESDLSLCLPGEAETANMLKKLMEEAGKRKSRVGFDRRSLFSYNRASFGVRGFTWLETIYQQLHSLVCERAGRRACCGLSIAIPILFVLSVFPRHFRLHDPGRTQSAGPHPKPHRAEPRRPLGHSPADCRRPEAAHERRHRAAARGSIRPFPRAGHRGDSVDPAVFAVVPVGAGLVPVNLNIGILFAFAVSTASVLALFMGGWASRNKFSLLGAMRAVAQVVSYEVPMVLAAVAVVMAVGSLSTLRIAKAQSGGILNVTNWFVFPSVGIRRVRPVHDRRDGGIGAHAVRYSRSRIGNHRRLSHGIQRIQIRAVPDGRISRVHRDGGDHRDDVPRRLQRPGQRSRLGRRLDLDVLVFHQTGVHDRAEHLDPWHVAAGARRPVDGICLESPVADVDRSTSCGRHLALHDLRPAGVGGHDLVARPLVRHALSKLAATENVEIRTYRYAS